MMSSSGVKEILDRCQFYVPIKEGYVLLQDPITNRKVIRLAKYYGNYVRLVEKLIEDRTIVDDAESMAEDKFVVIFYGTQDAALKLLESEKAKDLKRKRHLDDDIPLSQPTSSKKCSSDQTIVLDQPPRKLRSQSRGQPEQISKSPDLTTNRILRELEQQFNKFKGDMKEIKVMLSEFIESQDLPDLNIGPTKEASMAKQAYKAMKSMRKQGFEQKLASVDWEKLIEDDSKIREIKDILTTQEWPSKMVADIAEILWGEKLIDHILGRHGKRERKPRKGERQLTILRSEEEKLRSILSVFGTTFTTDTAWQILVQHYVNQRGRDMKNRVNKEKSDDKFSADDSEHDYDSQNISEKNPNKDLSDENER